jgi:LacI family transcriptional regulator
MTKQMPLRKSAQKTSIKRTKSSTGQVTIIDIASVAGVSKSTVSLVLQDSTLVRKETRESVRKVMDQLGYVYNRSAAGLRRAKSDFVGIVIGDLTNPFFPELAAGIEDVLAEHQMMPVLANANEDTQQQAQVIRALREHGVAGIILSPARGTTAWTISESIPKGLPVVVTMRAIESCPFPYVGPDNVAGVRCATEHLATLGHKTIAFLGGNNSFAAQRERVLGWRQALQGAGLVIDDRLIIDSSPTRAGGAEAVLKAMALSPKPTAAVCYNDVVALGASRMLLERKHKVGQDFSLVGFDDIAEAAHSYPSLTTISAGTRAMGREAAQRLLQLIAKKDKQSTVFLGEAKLIQRESTGAPSVEKS